MRRTLILSAIGTTAVVIGIGVGAAMARTDPPQPLPIAAHMMMADCPMTGMSGMTGMTGMQMTGMQVMMGSSMMYEQVPATANDHLAHHQEIRP